MKKKIYERNCPECNQLTVYKHRSSYYTAKKKNSICKKCNSLRNGFIERYATKGCNTGQDNAFYGKHHTKESKKKIVKDRDYSVYKTPEFRQKMSTLTSGEKAGMYGKSIYDVWIVKYGKKEANKKLKKLKKKHSKNNSGSGNPMYGKPAPNGSGNGWKGWYKGVFFRSLRELCFMIDHPEAKSGEKIRIKYKDYLGNSRTYAPDFIINNILYEIKPKRLHKTKNILLKSNAAKEYCKENKLKFKIIDYVIDKDKIIQELNNIKFQGNYLERFMNYGKDVSD